MCHKICDNRKILTLIILYNIFKDCPSSLRWRLIQFLSSVRTCSCKDEETHREFKKQCGASCVYYNDELAVLVVLVSNTQA